MGDGVTCVVVLASEPDDGSDCGGMGCVCLDEFQVAVVWSFSGGCRPTGKQLAGGWWCAIWGSICKKEKYSPLLLVFCL
jgi:hypothetical protein